MQCMYKKHILQCSTEQSAYYYQIYYYDGKCACAPAKRTGPDICYAFFTLAMIPMIVFVICCAFEAISVPLYFRILWLLMRRPKFSTPFYYFLILIGFSNLLNYFVVFGFYNLAQFRPTSNLFAQLPESRWISWIGFIIYYTAYQQDLLYLSVSLNRFTSVWWPFQQFKIWERHWRWHVLIAHLLPLPLAIHRFFSVGKFLPFDPNDVTKGYTPSPISYDFYYLDQSIVTIVLNGFCLIVSVALNVATYVKIKQMKAIIPTTPGVSTYQIEWNLFIMAIIMSATFLTSLFFQLALFLLRDGMPFQNFLLSTLNKGDMSYVLFEQLPWVNDLRVLSQPWILLVVSKEIRLEVIPILSRIRWHKAQQNKAQVHAQVHMFPAGV